MPDASFPGCLNWNVFHRTCSQGLDVIFLNLTPICQLLRNRFHLHLFWLLLSTNIKLLFRCLSFPLSAEEYYYFIEYKTEMSTAFCASTLLWFCKCVKKNTQKDGIKPMMKLMKAVFVILVMLLGNLSWSILSKENLLPSCCPLGDWTGRKVPCHGVRRLQGWKKAAGKKVPGWTPSLRRGPFSKTHLEKRPTNTLTE